MGTATLLHAAVREPQRFSGFTLVLPPTAWQTRRAMAGEYRRIADLVESEGVESWLQSCRGLPLPPAAIGRRDTVPHVRADLLPAVFRGAALSDLPSPACLTNLDVPTTILAWVGDPGHPLSTAEALADVLPRATVQVARRAEDVRRWSAVLAHDIASHGH